MEKTKIISRFNQSISESNFVKFTLGKYRGNEEELENVYAEPVLIQDEILYSIRYKYKTKDIFKNLNSFEASKLIEEHLGKDFLYGSLYTTDGDMIIEYNKKREPKLITRKATFTRVEIQGQNRIKPRFISNKARYLSALGITTSKGEVKSDKYFKFRQIDKFIEIVDSLYRDSKLADKDEIEILDLGSGKSYLTFALYDYFNNKLEKKAKVTGFEQKKELVELSNSIAEKSRFENLTFLKGSIIDLPVAHSDIVVALHACDTATDEAIAKALKSDAEIIILAPCCQKYVRSQIMIPATLKSIFHHGIIEEHVSSYVTDGLRALMLEAHGYKTKVFEFISQEHTAKNIMITAVKDKKDEMTAKAKLVEIEHIKSEFGLKDFYLDKLI